jgi:hypothetical protein
MVASFDEEEIGVIFVLKLPARLAEAVVRLTGSILVL